MVGGVELRDAGTLLSTAPGRTAVIALCKPEDREFVLASAHEAIATASASGLSVEPVTIRERQADESEWRDVWKQFFRATRVGRRFTVRPSWDPGPAPSGEFVIDLDPGRAFGTGAHPSTRMAIALAEHVRETVPRIARFLDLGCGSGILSIATARLWPEAMGLAIDNDPEATGCCQENLERNHVSTVAIVTGTLERAEGSFDLILANIQADVLCDLALAMVSKVGPEGRVILSGILCDQSDEVLAAYASAGFSLDSQQDEGEWTGLLMHKAASS
ncbi:MAG TPA: 50S ribosomal protein L11 methyltransferase [Polyangia bacterium]